MATCRACRINIPSIVYIREYLETCPIGSWTIAQHKQLEEGESSDMAEDSGSIVSKNEASHLMVKITEVVEDIQPWKEPAPMPFEPFTLNLPDPSMLY
jgi:hypothetical protein